MIRKAFSDISPLTLIILTIVLVLAGLIIFAFVGVVTAAIYTGNWDIMSFFSGNLLSEEGLAAMRIIQICQSFGIFLFPALLIAVIISKKPFAFLGFKKTSFKFLVLSVILIVVALPSINLLASLNAKIPMAQWMVDMEMAAQNAVKALLATDNINVMLVNFFMVAILPAVAEELLFRGVLQRFFCDAFKSTLAGVIFTAFLFSAIHMQFQGFIPRMALGLLFGYLYVWTKSIWIPIAVHFVNNGLAVIVFYLIDKGSVPAQAETFGEIGVYWQAGLVSLFAAGILTWIIYKESLALNEVGEASLEEL